MTRWIVVVGLLLSTSYGFAESFYNVLGWTADGASLVYNTQDDTGTAEEMGGYSGSASLAVVVDAASGGLTPYLLSLSEATSDEKKGYLALPDKQAFDTWLKAHPLSCAGGRQSPDGKAHADIKMKSKDFVGAWKAKGKRYEISFNNDEPGGSEAAEAILSITRDGKVWPPTPFSGRVAFYGAQGGTASFCWAPDGMRVAVIVHSDKTMRDPPSTDVRISTPDRAIDPEGERTAEKKHLMRARRANTAGMKAYRGKNYLGATKKFKEAIAADANLVVAHYNLACVAALQGDKAAAIAELKWLTASTDPEAKKKLKKAATDADLHSLADDPDAKTFFAPAP